MPYGRRHIIVLVFLFIQSGDGLVFSQKDHHNEIRFMFYNVENLFDIYDDSLTDDNEFLPGGTRRWNVTRYRAKINSLYKTIVASGDLRPPEIIAMCEVENRKVLLDLLYDTYLTRYNYSIVHEESADGRGIDVCLLYDSDVLEFAGYKTIAPDSIDGSVFSSRGILYSRLKAGYDTLHLFINHWPSRRGGVLAGKPARQELSMLLSATCDSLQKRSGDRAQILIAGDFNCSPEENPLTSGPGNKSSLVNLAAVFSQKGFGTYRYQGRWEMIDQVIVSGAMMNDSASLSTTQDMFKITDPEFLMREDPVYPGRSPWPTYSGYRYAGGYSDHLPVVLTLRRRPPD